MLYKNMVDTHARQPRIDTSDPTMHQDPDPYDQRGDPFLRVADGGIAALVPDCAA
jgi:hypothetical protein